MNIAVLPQALDSGASPTFVGLTLTGLTAGSVLFAGASDEIAQDNANLFWNNTDNRLGIGTASPEQFVHLVYEGTVAGGNPTADKWADAVGAMSWQMRKGRGTVAAPRRAKSGDVLGGFLGFGAEAANDTTAAAFPSSASANFRFQALEDHTSTGHGARVTIQTAPVGSTTLAQRTQVDTTGIAIGQSHVARSVTDPTNALALYNGTAPSGTLANGVQLYADTGTLKLADAAGTLGYVLSASAVNAVSPTAQNRTITVDIGGTTYYLTAKTTND